MQHYCKNNYEKVLVLSKKILPLLYQLTGGQTPQKLGKMKQYQLKLSGTELFYNFDQKQFDSINKMIDPENYVADFDVAQSSAREMEIEAGTELELIDEDGKSIKSFTRMN